MIRHLTLLAAVVPIILLSHGCKGSGGGSVQAPPVAVITPSPPPPAPPLPPPTESVAALVAPMQTASPPPPIAEVGGPSFAAPGSGAQLPLLLTAIAPPFAGDATTTQQGGVIDLAADGTLRLTLNNPALGVNRIALETNTRMSIPGGTFQSFADPSAGERNHVRRSFWIISTSAGKSGGVSSAGFVPRPASIPTTGGSTYSGTIGGLISEYHIANNEEVALLSGNVQLDVDFASRTVIGRITGLRVGSDGFYVTGLVNELTFMATYNVATNTYTGEVVSGPSPNGPNAFQAGARGTIVGQFYGPDAGESGAVLTLSDGTSRLIISFSAKR